RNAREADAFAELSGRCGIFPECLHLWLRELGTRALQGRAGLRVARGNPTAEIRVSSLRQRRGRTWTTNTQARRAMDQISFLLRRSLHSFGWSPGSSHLLPSIARASTTLTTL